MQREVAAPSSYLPDEIASSTISSTSLADHVPLSSGTIPARRDSAQLRERTQAGSSFHSMAPSLHTIESPYIVTASSVAQKYSASMECTGSKMLATSASGG